MLIDTCLMAVLLIAMWKWKLWMAIPIIVTFVVVDGAYFLANATKIPDGGWFPLVIGAFTFTLLTTWARGRKLMRETMIESALPIEVFVKSAQGSATRVKGTAIFMASATTGVPTALLHNMKHNKVHPRTRRHPDGADHGSALCRPRPTVSRSRAWAMASSA